MNYSQQGFVSVMWPSFIFWEPLPKFGVDEAKHFRFRTEIDNTIYWMINYHRSIQSFQYYPERGVLRGFNFLK